MLATAGLVVRRSDGSWVTRTLTAGSARLVVTDGDGDAGNPTVDFGSVALDDLSDAAVAAPVLGDVLLFDGANFVNAPLIDKDSTSIADFTIGEKFYLTQRLSTEPVSRINIVIQGTGGQSVTWELRKASDLSAAGVVIHTATITNVATGDTVTSITLPAIVVNDHVWFEFTATAGTLTAFNATVSF